VRSSAWAGENFRSPKGKGDNWDVGKRGAERGGRLSLGEREQMSSFTGGRRVGEVEGRVGLLPF